MSTSNHHRRTLWLIGILHAFTHAYNVALVPLYFQVQRDFRLASVGQATLLVTVMMLFYCAPSYPMGILADRFSRKKLLGFGLLLNAMAFVGLGLAPSYPAAMTCVALAGIGGCFYHPAANALVARSFPANTGRALGFVGVGASVGFFFGPLYAGWRAAQTGDWRAPIVELGIAGVLFTAAFYWLAEETPAAPAPHVASRMAPPMFPSAGLWIVFAAASVAFSLRDFAASSMTTLGSLFLQKAHGYGVQQTGAAISGIFIASALSNPLFGHLSDRGRGRWCTLVLAVAAAMVAIFPHMKPGWLVPTFLVYGFFQMASYPIVEAALMEAVPDAARGRAMGFWITVGGVVGNLAHWYIGQRVERFGAAASRPDTYFGLYAGLGLLMFLSILGLPCLRRLHRGEASRTSPVLRPTRGVGQPERRRTLAERLGLSPPR